MNLLIIIPTYNEIDNIERFIKTVFTYIPSDAAILVVDDNSPDGTAKTVEKMSADYPDSLHILNRQEKQGLASAYLAGFEWGHRNGDWDVFLEMDADFSHNPEYIPVMLEEIKTHEVVIGSRNIKGGGVEGWGVLRNFISKGGSLYSRFVLRCPIRDLTGGFNMWRKSALDKIDLSSIISKGYSFQIEMKYKAFRAGCSVKEIPILFVDRKQGKSKMSKKIFFEALLKIWEIKRTAGKDTGFDQFIKFSITGGLGTITNLLIFFLCADILKFPPTLVSIGCFIIAGTQNYIIDHKWSFRDNTAGEKLSLKKWLLFLGLSSLGLLVNLSVLNLILHFFILPYKFIAQAAGIAAGMFVNFFVLKFFVFRKGRIDNDSK